MNAISEDQPSTSTAELMVRTAIESFAELGYEATSMRLIARSVGVKPASLYNHFPSKVELLWAIVKDAIHELESLQQDADPDASGPLEALDTFVRVHIAYHAQNSQKARVVNTRLNILPPEYYDEVVAFRKRYEGHLQAILKGALASQPSIVDIIDLRTTSFAILEMGMAVAEWFKPEGPLTVEEVSEIYVEYAKRLITRRTGQ